MNMLLTLGLMTAVAAFGALTVLFLDARTRHLDALRSAVHGDEAYQEDLN